MLVPLFLSAICSQFYLNLTLGLKVNQVFINSILEIINYEWLAILQSDDDSRIQELSMQAIALLESVLREGINT